MGWAGSLAMEFFSSFFSPSSAVKMRSGQRWEGPRSSINKVGRFFLLLFFPTIKRNRYLKSLPVETHLLGEGLGGWGRGGATAT